jgi:hypothetical protein
MREASRESLPPRNNHSLRETLLANRFGFVPVMFDVQLCRFG